MKYYHNIQSIKKLTGINRVKSPLEIILYLLNVVNFILEKNHSEESASMKGLFLFIDADETKRIYIVSNNKIVSFAFPFGLSLSGSKVKVNYKSIELTAKIISYIVTIINECIKFKKCICDFSDLMDNNDADWTTAVNIYQELLNNEWGYIRYDYDPANDDKSTHPCNHLDVNCSTNVTYKLGLKQQINIAGFVDIINKKSNCWFCEKIIKESTLKSRFLRKIAKFKIYYQSVTNHKSAF